MTNSESDSNSTPVLLGIMKPSILTWTDKLSTNKPPLGVTPMLVTFVDLLGLITSMMLMSPLITTLNSWSWISDPPLIKVLLMKLGVFLIS